MQLLATLHNYSDIGLFILRATLAMPFLVHGFWKMQHGRDVATAVGAPKKAWFFILLGYAEFFGSLALLAGFLTQIAAAGLAIIMLGAIYFKTTKWHVPFTAHDKTGWEFDLILLGAALYLITSGAGAIGIDQYFNLI